MAIHSVKNFLFLASGSFTNTSFSATNEINVEGYDEGAVLISVTSDSGETPTLTIVLQTWSEALSVWFDQEIILDTLDVDAAAATTIVRSIPIRTLGKKLRCRYKVGGSGSPSITFSIHFVGKQ